ncbi:PLD nuclease N-terminal domain-containing protein [Bacillus sp. 03113]|uniref:PLD nuclease N-terminal domain-containing protein n=1 Tax=Bacillus sp. 03113 TaxID=2578211 RepID=UPI0011439F4C|nr:PLD nuclease N-terminal domain-containing protein [Bacillus sp. 03113]
MNVNWEIVAPIIVLQLILMISALLSLVKQRETNGPKWLWTIVIVFLTTFGPILYFIIGRKKD